MKRKKFIEPQKKKNKIEAVDSYTNCVTGSYFSEIIAADFYGCRKADVLKSIKDNSYTVQGLYFREKIFN